MKGSQWGVSTKHTEGSLGGLSDPVTFGGVDCRSFSKAVCARMTDIQPHVRCDFGMCFRSKSPLWLDFSSLITCPIRFQHMSSKTVPVLDLFCPEVFAFLGKERQSSKMGQYLPGVRQTQDLPQVLRKNLGTVNLVSKH
ncbi:unnamed protein product [Prunus armeniaca]